jgi:hypothetical protein
MLLWSKKNQIIWIETTRSQKLQQFDGVAAPRDGGDGGHRCGGSRNRRLEDPEATVVPSP